MIAILCGWLVGWLINGLSDWVAVRRLPNANQPIWQPFGGMWRTPRPRFATLHMAAEGFSMAMGAVIWARYTPAHAPLILGLYAFLLFVTLTDLKYRRVFNIATYSAAGMVLLALLLMPHRTVLMQHLVGGAMAFGIFALASITTRGALGGGDIKLAGVLGLAFGFPGILWVLLIGTGLGALLAVGALLSGLGSRTTRIAYAPFLCAGALVMLLLLAR